MKILTIGSGMRDIFIEHEVKTAQLEDVSYIILQEGAKIPVSNIWYATGGGATNSAVSFRRLGFDVESFFKIGKDQEGDFIVENLNTEEVDTQHVVRTTKIQTGTSFIIPSPTGNRAILVYRGANLTLQKDEIPNKAIQEANQLYVTSLSNDTSELLPLIVEQAQQNNISVACNPGTSQLTARVDTLEQALANIHTLILNCHEANLFMNAVIEQAFEQEHDMVDESLPPLLRAPLAPALVCFTLQQYFREILFRGPKIAVVTNGADGVYVTDGQHIYYHPSLKIDVVSTVGAGDAFGSTFVSYLAQGNPIQEAIQAGVINAASVLLHQDAQTGLLSLEQLEKQRKALDPSLLQIFDL